MIYKMYKVKWAREGRPTRHGQAKVLRENDDLIVKLSYHVLYV